MEKKEKIKFSTDYFGRTRNARIVHYFGDIVHCKTKSSARSLWARLNKEDKEREKRSKAEARELKRLERQILGN